MKVTVFIAACFTIPLIFSSCSSSSNSARYGTESKEKVEKDSPARFTSDDKQLKNKNEKTPGKNIRGSEENDPDDIPIEPGSTYASSFVERYSSKTSGITFKDRVIKEILVYLNTPYEYGGTTREGIDCSAFTQSVFSNALSISLLRSAREQFTQGQVVMSRGELTFGDLVFFNTRKSVKPGHVGIYIGDNLFAHASSKNGVIVSSLDHNYYSERYMGARHFELKDIF